MKNLGLIGLLLIAALFFGVRCTETDNDINKLSQITCTKLDTLTLSHSMKGWELYSFPVLSDWRYSLMLGTNAIKSYDMVYQNRVSVIGQDSLKVLLSKLPVNEEVIWVGRAWLGTCWQSNNIGDLTLPPRAVQIDIKEFCDNHGINLTIVE